MYIYTYIRTYVRWGDGNCLFYIFPVLYHNRVYKRAFDTAFSYSTAFENIHWLLETTPQLIDQVVLTNTLKEPE